MATIMNSQLCVQLFVAISMFSLCNAAVTKLWVTYNTETSIFEVSDQQATDYVAVASFVNTVNQTGWAKLDVTTQAGPKRKYNDSVQAYAAGFVEGHITKSLMTMHWANTGAWVCPEPLTSQCIQIKKFLESNLKWVLENIKTFSTTSPFWHHVRLFLEQTAGLQDGFAGMKGQLNLNIDVMSV
ncbi:phospholipase b-like 2 [Plakobranchus ocellatus]|uniref:Phospholipase B-like n=1 Tax=Plakobranchus ocellatus TaxID=259542 RepID=A0AAV4BBE4_9GAST|nr:phospholipase b-like 2 [Plakobranchus ocellatus]